MPGMENITLFALAALVLALTPGPDMLLIASRSASQGVRAGFATLAGIQAGVYCHALAAALGLSQLLQLVPLAYDLIRYLGAGYLLYLAWGCVRGGQPASVMAASTGLSAGTAFRQGLWTNLLNPKMALFVLALFPQFVPPAHGSLVMWFLLLATVLNGVGLLVNGVVIVAASRLARGLLAAPARRWPQYVLGGVFALLAGRLLWQPR
ncbi:MAG: LysE family translocator [Vogesella sp.]|uniref:LysE family translocator n=1 Tax=Vogesella sp. TaxID=1904252 RepID=UPI003F2D8D95